MQVGHHQQTRRSARMLIFLDLRDEADRCRWYFYAEDRELAEQDEADRDQVRMYLPEQRVEKLLEKFHKLKGY